MGEVEQVPAWDDERTEPVAICYVRHHGTSMNKTYIRPGTPIRVCKGCRGGEQVCRCSWRTS